MARRLRVLHLPFNMASVMHNNVVAQRAIGLDARGYILEEHSSIVDSSGLSLIPRLPSVARYAWLARKFMWADIVHWYWWETVLPRGRDLGLLRRLGKPCVVEWMGSDIRDHQLELVENPFYRRLWQEDADFRDQCQRMCQSYGAQERFMHVGAWSLAHPGMVQYLIPAARTHSRVVMRGLDISKISLPRDRVQCDPPIVVHAPSRRAGKGTRYVLEAVDRLRAQGGVFEFRLIEGLEHGQALAEIAKADVFVDQMIVGDYGVASIEAMAMGVPTICFVKDSIVPRYPAEPPIVNATIDSLPTVLGNLLADRGRRHSLGLRSREYVERHHDIKEVANSMKAIYTSVIGK